MDLTSSVYTAPGMNADAAAAVNQAMTLVLAAASQAHPVVCTIKRREQATGYTNGLILTW